MTSLHPFAGDNLLYLEQALELLAEVSDEFYAQAIAHAAGSSIGAHLRHILDHYDSFLHGLESGRIDYDRRDRDARSEIDRGHAAVRLRAIIRRFEDLGEADAARSVEVRMDCGGGEGERQIWSRSSVTRELQFLVSHTVHHNALIAFMLRRRGHEPMSGFGVAPSTLSYLRARSSRA